MQGIKNPAALSLSLTSSTSTLLRSVLRMASARRRRVTSTSLSPKTTVAGGVRVSPARMAAANCGEGGGGSNSQNLG